MMVLLRIMGSYNTIGGRNIMIDWYTMMSSRNMFGRYNMIHCGYNLMNGGDTISGNMMNSKHMISGNMINEGNMIYENMMGGVEMGCDTIDANITGWMGMVYKSLLGLIMEILGWCWGREVFGKIHDCVRRYGTLK